MSTLKLICEAVLAGVLGAGTVISGLKFWAAYTRHRALRRLGER